MRNDERMFKELGALGAEQSWKGIFAFTKEGRKTAITTFQPTNKIHIIAILGGLFFALMCIIQPMNDIYITATFIGITFYLTTIISFGSHTWIHRRYLKE